MIKRSFQKEIHFDGMCSSFSSIFQLYENKRTEQKQRLTIFRLVFSLPGVCLSHAALISAIASYDAVTSDDIYFNAVQLHWISGLSTLLVGTFNGATRIITAEPLSCEKYLSLLEKHKVTNVFFGFSHLNQTIEAISKKPIDSVKHMVLAGTKIPFFMKENLNSVLPNGSANIAYGCTELGGVVTYDLPDFSGNDSVGRLLSAFSIKITDDEGARCGIETSGEICMKGSTKFLGYYGERALTERTIDNEGFFHTGDIGRFDKDGNLYVIGRKIDLLGYPSYISPHEIEEVLIKSLDIESVCVVGITFELGHEVPAAVVVRSKRSASVTENDVFNVVAGI